MGGGVRKRKDKKIMRPHISSQSPEFSSRLAWPATDPPQLRENFLKTFNKARIAHVSIVTDLLLYPTSNINT